MIDPDALLFAKFYPESDDITLNVLKGHLILESYIREIFTSLLNTPKALAGKNGTSFECHQIICLVEAILPEDNRINWVWLAAKKLNSLRNNLAHNIDTPGREHKINDFIKFVFEHAGKIHTALQPKPCEMNINLAIQVLCAMTSTVKDRVLSNQTNSHNK